MIPYEDIPRSFNLTSWFLDRNLEEGRGDRVALVCGEETVTYAELAQLTNRVGHVLLELGVRTEDRVLLALSDGQAFVAAWYAALKIGAAVAEAYTFLQVKDYAYYVDYMRARVVVVDQNTLAKVEEAVAGMRFPPRLLVVGGSFDELVAQAPDELEPAADDARTTWRSGSSQPAPPGRRRRLFTPRTTRWSRSSAMHSASSATRRTTSSCPSRSSSSATRET